MSAFLSFQSKTNLKTLLVFVVIVVVVVVVVVFVVVIVFVLMILSTFYRGLSTADIFKNHPKIKRVHGGPEIM